MTFKKLVCHWRYYVYRVFTSRAGLFVTPLSRWLHQFLPTTSYSGVKICSVSLRDGSAPQFFEDTINALKLIESFDARRFRRIQRELCYISNYEKPTLATYARPLRDCQIDYARLKPIENAEWTRWYYATILVHEATHGAIHSRQIAYIKPLRKRIERLCHLEAKRFAKNADNADRKWSNALVGEFDERHWDFLWHSTLRQRLSRHIARMREAYKNA